MKKAFCFLSAVVLLTGIAALSTIDVAVAASITVDGVNAFRDVNSANTVGFLAGDSLTFGALSVVPNGDNGTTGVATQGSVTRPVSFIGSSVGPNQFGSAVPYNQNLTGSWTLTFTNGPDTTIVQTPGVGPVPALPFASSVAMTNNANATPTFSWTFPNGFVPNAVVIRIFDLQSGHVGTSPLDNLVDVHNLPGNSGSLQIPKVFSSGIAAEINHLYSFEISPVLTRNHVALGDPTTILSESRSFFNFELLKHSLPPGVPVYLPIVDVKTGQTVVYTFNAAVVKGAAIYVDPLVATGYDYAIGAGNPNFASVTLPTGIQNTPFGLYLFNGTDFVLSTNLNGGDTFAFPDGGVDRFRILGIDPSAGLDPNDATAFVTGLTFEDDGVFTGTMTAITTNVPEPATMILLFAGLIGIVSTRKLKGSY